MKWIHAVIFSSLKPKNETVRCTPNYVVLPGTSTLCTGLITNGVFTSGSLARNFGLTHSYMSLDSRDCAFTGTGSALDPGRIMMRTTGGHGNISRRLVLRYIWRGEVGESFCPFKFAA